MLNWTVMKQPPTSPMLSDCSIHNWFVSHELGSVTLIDFFAHIFTKSIRRVICRVCEHHIKEAFRSKVNKEAVFYINVTCPLIAAGILRHEDGSHVVNMNCDGSLNRNAKWVKNLHHEEDFFCQFTQSNVLRLSCWQSNCACLLRTSQNGNSIQEWNESHDGLSVVLVISPITVTDSKKSPFKLSFGESGNKFWSRVCRVKNKFDDPQHFFASKQSRRFQCFCQFSHSVAQINSGMLQQTQQHSNTTSVRSSHLSDYKSRLVMVE